MRLAWAVLAGLLLGAVAAWWVSRDAPGQSKARQQRAEQAAAEQARDAVPALYRWRDDAGTLQITDQPPQGRPYERIARDPERGIEVRGN
ncbi:hypothetical protein CSC70_12405 [Pseudoxanthomonas kalamensis DSM 18571]|uniref:DUF4124 domain-containing protein n=1 Tax=Pseudoxanthomonas kalamensis TaxID=289483 RepID=UPI0013919B95|nr:DUF4124 domain-containing protein [Pseudoxanthomonas kalamensis]KAF1708893.1 hypothetical protein CSC70_12405 [Pseudoxanthomonas kalamensis DSM 18571]